MLPYAVHHLRFHLWTYGLLERSIFLTRFVLTSRLAKRKRGSSGMLNLASTGHGGNRRRKDHDDPVDFGDYARNPAMLFSVLSHWQAAGIVLAA